MAIGKAISRVMRNRKVDSKPLRTPLRPEAGQAVERTQARGMAGPIIEAVKQRNMGGNERPVGRRLGMLAARRNRSILG